MKARIEEFSALAGHEHIHKGMTSRDLTENVEQLQVRLALELIRDRMVAALARLAEPRRRARRRCVITGRSHNVAAQATTLGKRFANAGEELLQSPSTASRSCSPATRCAGIKGPVGTQQDQLDLLDGDSTQARRARAPRSPRTSGFDARARPTSARCTRARSTSTSCRALVQAAAGPSSWPRPSG